MKGKKERKHILQIQIWGLLAVLVGVSLFLCAYVLLTQKALSDTAKLEAQTMSFLKNRVMEYDNYLSNDKTKSLIHLLDKTTELSHVLQRNEPDDAPELMQQYVEEQRLAGVLLLDEQVKLTALAGEQALGLAILDVMRAGNNLEDIAAYPRKKYMFRGIFVGDTYDVAAAARMDAGGVIICFEKKNTITGGINDITLETMFADLVLDKNAAIVVSDEQTILATNREGLRGKTFAEGKARYTGTFDNRTHGLIRIWDNKNVTAWYGGKSYVKDYLLYVFYPSAEVFSVRTEVLLVMMTAYILFLLLLLLFRDRSEKVHMQKMQKQYQTIQAIGHVYTTLMLVTLDSGEIELVKAPDELRESVQPRWDFSQFISHVCKNFVAESYREGLTAFSNIYTLTERLEGQELIGFRYEDARDNWLYTVIVPQRVDADGTIRTVLFAVRNITETKKKELVYQQNMREAAELARRANIAKTDFLRRMSHDIRTPINGIRGMLEIADHFPKDVQKQRECREKMWQASGFLLDLVNNVLDMNKLESGEVTITNEPLDLLELIHDVDEIAQIQAQEAGIRYVQEAYQIEHTHVLGSPVHLHQILQNISSNAIKYNRPGGMVRVSSKELEYDGSYALYEFVCEDTGIGMSEEFQKHAFEPFSQANDRARTVYSGTGLGLAITKELVEVMGGTIQMESRLGTGTRFVITLRFLVDHLQKDLKKQKEQLETDIAGMRVLLVEDNEMNMEIAKFLLEDKGVVITEAWNGQEALEIFRKQPTGTFDVILMDVMMPLMDGLEATRRIRALKRSDAARIPIFAMTANAFLDDRERSREAGMNEHLTKPLDIEALSQMLGKYKTH